MVALTGLATGVLGLVFAAVSLLRVRGLRRAYDILQAGENESLVAAVGRQITTTRALRSDVVRVQSDVAALRTDLATAVRHIAVLRYDAFQDLGGRLSFSAALLDDGGDGLVLTSINGRTETRTYAKGIKNGQSIQPLSPEETKVVGHASRVAASRAAASEVTVHGTAARTAAAATAAVRRSRTPAGT